MSTIKITDEGLDLTLSEPRIVMTRRGERYVRAGLPTDTFWTAWRANKPAIKAAGYSVSKNPELGIWEVTHWSETMTVAARVEAHEASRAADAAVTIPVGEGCELMPFQRAGIAYALPRKGTLIADEMGLGKTIQAIAFANAIGARRILIVPPASVLINWRNEISKWQTLGLPITIVRPGMTVPTGEGWVVINYDLVSRAEFEPALKASEWDLVVFDEAQYLKSRTAKRTKALLGGGRSTGIKAKRALALTGTPIMNRPAELFSLLHYLDPARWPTWGGFARRYCAGEQNAYGFDTTGASNLDELNARLRETVMVRRLKSDVLTELPAKRRQIIALDPGSDAVRAIIDHENETHERMEAAIAAANTAMLRAETANDEAAYKAAVARLKTARAVAFTEIARVRHATAVAKLPMVLDHIMNTNGIGKVLVFAHHHDVIDGLVTALAPQGVVKITGNTPPEKRQGIVEQFQTDPSIRFFVGNIKAAGIGLTLTASSHVVFAELDWTPSAITQAEDRAHRIGQADNVLVQHLVLDGSLDSRMAKLVVAKQAVIDAALNKRVEPTAVEEESAADEITEISLPPPPVSTIDADRTAAIHAALRIVAGMDADRARERNDVGFNRYDTEFGCELAERSTLTPRQAAAGMKLMRKYRRQYPADLYERIFGAAS